MNQPAAEFVLIPRSMYMQSRQSVQQLLEDPSINAKADQLSYLKRITEAIDPTPPPPSADDSSASSATQTNKILSDLATLPGGGDFEQDLC